MQEGKQYFLAIEEDKEHKVQTQDNGRKKEVIIRVEDDVCRFIKQAFEILIYFTLCSNKRKREDDEPTQPEKKKSIVTIENNCSYESVADSPLKESKQPILTTLNPVKFTEWSKEQVYFLLCTSKENGGAGLPPSDVKSLYIHDFKGISLDNIVKDILKVKKKQSALQNYALYEVHKSFGNTTRDILKRVVNWVEDLLKTRLYHLWSDKQVKKKLLKEIDVSEENYDRSYAKLDGSILHNIMKSDNPLQYMSNTFKKSNSESNQLIISFIRSLTVTCAKIPFPTNAKQYFANELELELFLKNQKTIPRPNIVSQEGLYFSQTVSRNAQLLQFSKGILRQYVTCLTGQCRAKDNCNFSVSGPVGSGKTHFLYFAISEIIRKLENDQYFKKDNESYFLELWKLSTSSHLPPPNDPIDNLLILLKKHYFKVFASQRNDMSLRSFPSLSIDEYIAMLLAVNCLAEPRMIYDYHNFNQVHLSLNQVVNLILTKRNDVNSTVKLAIEIDIDEIQELIEYGIPKGETKASQLVQALYSLSRRRDILFIIASGGTVFLADDNRSFISLSNTFEVVVSLTPLSIKDAVDVMITASNTDIKPLFSIEEHDLANLLSFLGPLPRTVELLMKSVPSLTTITALTLYKSIKRMLRVKYEDKEHSMMGSTVNEVAQILKIMFERGSVADNEIVKALMRGLVCKEQPKGLSIVLIYLDLALESNLLRELDGTFIGGYIECILQHGVTSSLMEQLIAQFINFKSNIYYVLKTTELSASKFFHGALLGPKVHEITLSFTKKMTYTPSPHSSAQSLRDVTSIKSGFSVINMKENSIAVPVGNVWSRSDRLISFSNKQFLAYEAKIQPSTPCEGKEKKDSFEYEQDRFYSFAHNIEGSVLFLHVNAGVTTMTNVNFNGAAKDYSMLVDRNNWKDFFKIIPKVYYTTTEKLNGFTLPKWDPSTLLQCEEE